MYSRLKNNEIIYKMEQKKFKRVIEKSINFAITKSK